MLSGAGTFLRFPVSLKARAVPFNPRPRVNFPCVRRVLRFASPFQVTASCQPFAAFLKQNDGSFAGTLKTLNITANLIIVPATKISDNAPDYRVYASGSQRYEVGAAWSQVAKTSGETYLNLKIAAPEFGQNWVRARIVKLEEPREDGTTHLALWEPREQ